METIILIILSILPVFLIGLYIRFSDKNKEPAGLIIKLFLGGLGAIVVTTILTLIISMFYPDILEVTEMSFDYTELFFISFFAIGLVEEFSKWIFVYSISFNNKHFDETFDMIVYAVFVSLGFACIENIMYVLQGGIKIALLRSVLSVPGHACFGVYMGYYLLKTKMCTLRGDKKNKNINMFKSIIIPMLLHGAFDFLVFCNTGIAFFILVVLVIILYVFVIIIIVRESKSSLKFKYKYNFCGICGRRVDSRFCPICGSKNE